MSKDHINHETACIGERAEIGAGLRIGYFSAVMSSSRCGKSRNRGQKAVVSPSYVIGENARILEAAGHSLQQNGVPVSLGD